MHRFVPPGLMEGEPIREKSAVTLAVGDDETNEQELLEQPMFENLTHYCMLVFKTKVK